MHRHRSPSIDSMGDWGYDPDKPQVDTVSRPSVEAAGNRGEGGQDIAMALRDNLTKPEAAAVASFKPALSSLFVFWKRRELSILAPATLASTAVAGAKISFAVVLGMIFQEVANLGSGFITGEECLARVGVLCLVLAGIGLLKALSGAFFMALWILHGEMRARIARGRLFQSLLTKSMAWFDNLEDGTTGIMTELQT